MGLRFFFYQSMYCSLNVRPMKFIAIIFIVALLSACNSGQTVINKTAAPGLSLEQAEAIQINMEYQRSLSNPAAFIPAQCYTKTSDAAATQGQVSNPCYACHTTPMTPNFIDDAELQLSYDFSETPRNNRWHNLFKDRRQQVAAISDEEIKHYIRKSNYFDADGSLTLARKLKKLPRQWDSNGNGKWDGVVPDLWYNFDAQGFDRDRNGDYTGWRSFAYYPFLGTFWPTNGATDDVLIRLPKAMQQDANGQFDLTIYKTNLAIVEAMLREQSVRIESVDEAALGGIDINKDGKIAQADQVTYDWAPRQQRYMWYVGKAFTLQKQKQLHIAAGLYPEGTEFLHTVRYVDRDDKGNVILSERIKEVRYARKRQWLTYSRLRALADAEFKEKRDFPNRLRTVRGNHEFGVSNGQGWDYAAFIENAKGELRPQTYEELVFCVGCHSGVGVTRDGIFSLTRKFGFDQFQQGWYHWSQKSIKGVNDPLREDGQYEYAFYLEQNRAGDEFRANTEIMEKFFNNGKLHPEQRLALQNDITELLWPSAERALLLNKAYKVIVEEQSFIHGRDATVSTPENVHKEIDAGQETGIKHTVKAQQILQ